MQKYQNEIDVKKYYRDRVLGIWKKFENHSIFLDPESEYRKHPLLPEKVTKNTLMFIGMNPSFRKGSVITENEKEIGFYQTQKNNDFKDITYFKKMMDIAKYCSSDWTHLDLFFLRETNQKIIERLSYTDVDFLTEQLNISFEIIEKANPKLIIVSNALAAEFFGKKKLKHHNLEKIWKGYNLFFEGNTDRGIKSTFNSTIGTYEIELNNKRTPIIFCGMLSGQRALDIGSYERLKWQSKMILNIESNKNSDNSKSN